MKNIRGRCAHVDRLNISHSKEARLTVNTLLNFDSSMNNLLGINFARTKHFTGLSDIDIEIVLHLVHSMAARCYINRRTRFSARFDRFPISEKIQASFSPSFLPRNSLSRFLTYRRAGRGGTRFRAKKSICLQAASRRRSFQRRRDQGKQSFNFPPRQPAGRGINENWRVATHPPKETRCWSNRVAKGRPQRTSARAGA